MDLNDILKCALKERLKPFRHVDLPPCFKKLGMPSHITKEGKTKVERIEESYSDTPVEDIPNVAEKYLAFYCDNPRERNKIQDILWQNSNYPKIERRYRKEIADSIGADFYTEPDGFDKLLEDLFCLDKEDDLFYETNNSLRQQISQHIHLNPGDWDADYLFKTIGVYDSIDKRFSLFIEGLSSYKVRADEEEQRNFVKKIKSILNSINADFIEVGTEEGYPTFKIVSMSSNKMDEPKNIIFASTKKPDIRLSDAVSNSIEILDEKENVLVYNRSLKPSGLTWNDLQDWWMNENSLTDDIKAKEELYKRLLSCLPKNSPPQRNLFESYYKHFRDNVPSLPVLLPEVWLYWDHKTVDQRGIEALKNQRMDFLLLLSNQTRVVIEVDGKQHYSDKNGNADVREYTKLVEADREMKLLGYELYRFSGYELQDKDKAQLLMGDFFDKLFIKNGIIPSRSPFALPNQG